MGVIAPIRLPQPHGARNSRCESSPRSPNRPPANCRHGGSSRLRNERTGPSDGCPIAIEVLDGDTADQMTLAVRIDKPKQRVRLKHVVLVGDRGLTTQARITEEIRSLTGSPRGAPRPSKVCCRAARCRSRCSTATWLPSRLPTSRASAWWSAAIPIRPPRAAVSASNSAPGSATTRTAHT